ncbi:MAG: polymerase sigma-70 factor [bacterium]|nr:polymerase sigma-70 factor [bacterium]
MPQRRATDDLASFEAHRPQLIALAYRMLGDVGRAQDMVQEAWLRWHHRDVEVRSPQAFLITIVTRLCLNQLDAASVRREESRGDRLPEPVDLAAAGMDRLESVEQISMAFVVMLERLSPAERAVLLLHEVFDYEHEEIATLVSRSPAACRKLLERARSHVAAERRTFSATREEHARLLDAFMRAASSGDVAALIELLADEAVLVTDGGPGGRQLGGLRNLKAPLDGAARVAAFIAASATRVTVEIERRELNGQPAAVLFYDGAPLAAILLAVADQRIQRVFFHADPTRLRFLGAPPRD